MIKTDLPSPHVRYTTQYYRDHREKESKRRLSNYYKNRYGVVDPEKIEEFKQAQKRQRSDTKKLNQALRLIRDIPSAPQYLLSKISCDEST